LGAATGWNGWLSGMAVRRRRRGPLNPSRRSRSPIVDGAGQAPFGARRRSTARSFFGPQWGRSPRSVMIAVAISSAIASP